MFTANGKRVIVSRDQVFCSLVVFYSLFLHKNMFFLVMFIYQIYFGQFISVRCLI